MSLSRRKIVRAGVFAFGTLALAACHDSTAPLNVTPDQLQSIGESIATETALCWVGPAPKDIMHEPLPGSLATTAVAFHVPARRSAKPAPGHV